MPVRLANRGRRALQLIALIFAKLYIDFDHPAAAEDGELYTVARPFLIHGSRDGIWPVRGASVNRDDQIASNTDFIVANNHYLSRPSESRRPRGRTPLDFLNEQPTL
jgi:hypothetical protein